MFNKKALSPLIATVLLIAFAVALGAMIMNWTSGINQPDSAWTDSPSSPCVGVQIELSKAFGKLLFCYDDDSIKFNILNSGTKVIEGIELRTLNSDLKEVKQDLPDSKMMIGDTLSKSIKFDKSGKVHVELVPFINVDGKKVYCPKKAIVQDVLPDCS